MGVRYPVSGAVAAASSLLHKFEAPTGTINGSNVTFTMSKAPVTNPAHPIVVFQNGLAIDSALYAVSGATLTFSVAPLSGDTVYVYYPYLA